MSRPCSAGAAIFPASRDANPARRGFAERQAINAPLQGSAADIIKRAMSRLPQALRAARPQARMLLQVHDELVFEAPKRGRSCKGAAPQGGDGGGLRAEGRRYRCRSSSKPARRRLGRGAVKRKRRLAS